MTAPKDFIDALRRLASAARIADLDALELDVDIQALDEMTAKLATAAVDEPRMQAALTGADMHDRMDMAFVTGQGGRGARIREVGIGEFFPYSPYVGPLNAMAPPVAVEVVDGDERYEVRAQHCFAPITNGPPGGVHGGVIAGVFDELLGSVCVLNDVAGFTGTLTVRYRSLTPLERPITMRGWIDRVDGRKTYARGSFHHGDTLCAEAEGVFISIEEPLR